MAKGKKRRKRRTGPGPVAAKPKPRTPPEPVARRTARDERPLPAWGSFPLTELAIFVGLVMLIIGFAAGGTSGTFTIAVGIALAALGGLEIAVREHFAGYRSHSVLLALACAIFTAAVIYALAIVIFGSVVPLVPVVVAVLVFIPAVLAMRNAFRRASGGLSVRIGRLRG